VNVRERAKEIGGETVVVPVHGVGGLGDGDSVEPQLRYRRTLLLGQSAAADAHADWIAGYLARGCDGLDSARLLD
jgi:hypothetical protein